MPPTIPNDFPLLRAFAACHQLFKLLATQVRSRPGVSRVNHDFDLSTTPADTLRLTEYLSPERIDGLWVYWQLEILISPDGSATVKAEALGADPDGCPLREVIAASTSIPRTTIGTDIVEITHRLCASNPV